jgi:hypothetical protein
MGRCRGVHVAVNSLAMYAAPRARLLRDLAAAGVPMRQVHVFLGGSESKAAASADGGRYLDEASGAWHYRVPHNSVDFTAMVHIAENAPLFEDVTQWFYLHDTTSVGANFWANATRWCTRGLPACALPLTRYLPTSSMGLYDAAFLRTPAALSNISVLKNRRATGMRWKIRGVGWEDKLFKVCDAESTDAPIRRFTRRCENRTLGRRTCICNGLTIDTTPVRVYGEDSTPRQVWRYDCADVSKFKANWARNQTGSKEMIIAV